MTIPHLVAHRGFMEHYPENTLLALEAALQCGARYLEFDVQSSSDGQLVVFHDATLKRTTGIEGNIFDMTLDELLSVRAHEPERFSLAFFNERIPSLADAIELLQRYPQAWAFVEIKEESIEQFGIESVIPKLMRELESLQSRCAVISYHYEGLRYVEENSDFATGWVLHDYADENHRKAIELNPDYLIINHRKIPPEQEPWPGDWQWMVYDVTDPELAIHYSTFDIPLIETRDIGAMLEHPVLALNTIHDDV